MFYYNIKEYVKIYHDFIPLESCQIIIDDIEKTQWSEHSYSDGSSGEMHRYEHEFLVNNHKSPEVQQLMHGIWGMLQKYMNEHIGWASGWYNSWSGYTPVRFNKYVKDSLMRKHCDHIHTIFDGQMKGVPILTVLGALNNDYEGGDLLMWEDEKIELPAGAVMIFPSNFMYPHHVSPITKGTRYSYVSWVW
jgi:predicted 2-oxoglutarate/Fe(II)-dependent dioxygenase YbiX